MKSWKEGDPEYRDVWDRYLDHLAVTVDNLRMAFDCDVVLGGYVGSFIGPYIKELRSRLAALDIFDHDGSYARAADTRRRPRRWERPCIRWRNIFLLSSRR